MATRAILVRVVRRERKVKKETFDLLERASKDPRVIREIKEKRAKPAKLVPSGAKRK